VADYTTTRAVKDYLHITSHDADAVLAKLVTRASVMIDTYCGRWFTPIIETRQYQPRGSHITGRLLLLDADLLSVSAITVGEAETLNPSSYILRPVNWPPYFGISLKQNSLLRWGTIGGLGHQIAVSGTWGYALSVPDPVVTAAIRLTAWLYRQFDSAVDEKPDEQAARLPGEIRQLLGPYVRLRISAYSGAA
jgi:hypothetical protein